MSVLAGKPECPNSSMLVTPFDRRKLNSPSRRSRRQAGVVDVRQASDTPVIGLAAPVFPPLFR